MDLWPCKHRVTLSRDSHPLGAHHEPEKPGLEVPPSLIQILDTALSVKKTEAIAPDRRAQPTHHLFVALA